MKVLWLASWYPNKLNPYNGDFIQRHAEAVSLYASVHVIHLTLDLNLRYNQRKLERFKKNNLTEEIIYYGQSKFGLNFLNKFSNHHYYLKFYRKAIQSYILKNGKPDLIHVNTGMNAGVLALWAQKKYGIPYVVTEHWTGLLKEADSKLEDLGLLINKLWGKVWKQAKGISVVSNYLRKALLHQTTNDVVVIPNVVNTDIFFPPTNTEKSNSLKFTHISHFKEHKNPDLIISAFAGVVKKIPEAKLQMIGGKDKRLVEMVRTLQLEDNIDFIEEIPPIQLVAYIRDSAALILFSKYETFGCVIIEANATGIPVLVNDSEVMLEIVENEINGLIAKTNSLEDLTHKMLLIASQSVRFDSAQISQSTIDKFSYSVVGEQIVNWYKTKIGNANTIHE